MRTYRDMVPTFADQGEWNLPHILRARAASHGDRVYLDVPGDDVRLTYAETLDLAERGAAALLRNGEPGDRVLIMSANRAEVILGWFSAALAGMAEVPINTAYSGSFLEHQVRTTSPRFAILEPGFAERFDAGNAAYASIEIVYVLEGEGEAAAIEHLKSIGWDARPWRTLLEGGVAELPEVRTKDLACILFTSGTTGLSKGVMMSHGQMEFFADECVSLTRLTDADVYMSVGPLFHGNAQFLAAYPALIAGARFVLRPRFSPSNWAAQIRDCGATVTNFVGVMMDWTWKQPEREDDADNDLRCIFAAPTASSIVDRFKERFGVEAFVEVFGLTETSMPILSPYGVDRPAGAAGLLAEDYFEVRLVDPETDAEVPTGEVGELTVRAKLPWTMCSGYYNMPEKTAEAQRNLWFHTGDGLRQDEDGWFYFVDRLKDTIRRRGENISSFDVESAVIAHDAVAECAAYAVPDGFGGDDVMVAIIAADPSQPPQPAELFAFLEASMPAHMIPRYVDVVGEIPRNATTLRVQKFVLRERGVTATTWDRTTPSGW